MTPRRTRQVRAGAALLGATLLVHGEDTEPPGIPGDGPRPDHPRPRQPATMPQPEIGLFRLGHVVPPMPPPRLRLPPPRAAAPLPADAPVSVPRPELVPPPDIATAGSPAPPSPTPPPPEPAAVPDTAAGQALPVAAPPRPEPVLPAPDPPVAEPTPPAAPADASATVAPVPPPAPEPPLAQAAEPPATHEVTHLALAMPKPAFGQVPASPRKPAATPEATPASATAPAPASRFPEPAFGRPAPDHTRLALPHPSLPTGLAPPPVAPSATALTPPAAAPMAGFVPAAPFTADDELILQLETAHGELSETITAYGTRAGVYLPLGELARLLDLALTVSDDGRYAAGWVLDESTRVAVNLREGTLRVGEKVLRLAPRDASAFDGELYLRAERLADLMPLALAVDLRAQTVRVNTLQPFPFEQRAAREDARTRLAGRSSGGTDRRYPREPDPWQALSFPLGDIELRGLADTGRGSRGEADLRLSGDLAFMTARVFASASTGDGLVAARVQLGRRDPDARLLGPLHATEFQLGDVGTSALPVGLRGVAGRGALVTNQPLERLSVFDRIDLRGELPTGYEAELYRNNTLVGSTRSPVNGRYEFLQVPVEFGLNVFRLVLYGPQGQRREEVRRISVGDGRLARGELIYNVGLAQKDVNLAGVRMPGFVPGLDHGAWRATAQAQYGLTTGVTAALGAAWYQAGGTSHWLVTPGLRTGIGGLAARLDLGIQDGQGTAISTGLGGRTFGVNWTASHAEYLGRFTDEVRAFTGEALRRASRFDLAANVRLGPARSLPLAGRLERIEYADGRSELDASLRASLLISRVLASNSLAFTRAAGPNRPAHAQLTGTFDLATLSGRQTQLRGALDYSFMPAPRLDAVRIEVDRAFGPETLVKASLARSLASGDTGFGLSAIRRFRHLSLAFDGTYALPGGTYAAIVRLGFGFGRNPLSRRLFTARPGLSDSGAVAIRAWADEDGDRAYSPGEPLLGNVEFDTGSASGKTDRNGVALIGNIGDGTRTSLHINGETLPDIAMAPAGDGIELIPRAGRIHVSQFAIEALSDIAGTARFGANPGTGKGVSGLALVLVDPAAKAIARTRSESGGAFLFEQVRPGDYRIMIDPAQARRLGIVLAGENAVRVGPKSSVIRVDVHAMSAP